MTATVNGGLPYFLGLAIYYIPVYSRVEMNHI